MAGRTRENGRERPTHRSTETRNEDTLASFHLLFPSGDRHDSPTPVAGGTTALFHVRFYERGARNDELSSTNEKTREEKQTDGDRRERENDRSHPNFPGKYQQQVQQVGQKEAEGRKVTAGYRN